MDEELKKNEEETAEAQVIAEPKGDSDVSAEDVGNVKISSDVVSTIAGIATTEVNGVAGMYGTLAGGIAEMFGAKKSPSKGVKVDMAEGSVTIDLYIVVKYSVRIPELAWEVQENVKNSVETMTGLEVKKVNIHIEGVSFDKDKADEPAPVGNAEIENDADDTEDEITD